MSYQFFYGLLRFFIFIIIAVQQCKGEARHHQIKCIHSELMKNYQIQHFQPVEVQGKSKNQRLLSLDPNSVQSIRITINSTELETSVKDTSKRKVFQDLLLAASTVIESRIRINRQISNIVAPPACTGIVLPNSDNTVGIANSDLHIYAVGVDVAAQSYLAASVPCSSDINGRPVVGLVKLNFNALKETSDRDFQKYLDAVIHEFIHILGFSAALFPTFLKSDGLTQWGADAVGTITIRSISTKILKFPLLIALAKSYFNCDTIEGVPLENEGSSDSIGSHFERTILNDELMTFDFFGPTKALSVWTLTLLEDSGWYLPNYQILDGIYFGRSKGCDFFNNACQSTTSNYTQFCKSKKDHGCTGNSLGKGDCSLPDPLADGCGILIANEKHECFDPIDKLNDEATQVAQQTFDQTARCFKSSLGGFGKSKCYKFSCTETNTIEISLGEKKVICKYNQETLNDVANLEGTIYCPKIDVFCGNQRNLCQNWCSSQGSCIGGICTCIQGRMGEDCSISSCSSLQFVDSSGTCLNSCPNGKFGNQYNHLCMNCDSSCATCTNFYSNSCTSCPSGKALTAESTCVETCPIGFYNDLQVPSAVCQTCDDGCLSCKGAGTSNCLSCQTPLWVENFQCQVACSVGKKQDSQFRECSDTCRKQKIDNGGLCQKCPNLTYLPLGTNTCLSVCPDGTFELPGPNICEKCDSSCKTCHSSDDTSCKSCSTGLYLFGSSCISECPMGTYQDFVNNQCGECNEICYGCTGPSENQCTNVKKSTLCLSQQQVQFFVLLVEFTKCKFGFYLSGTTCGKTCEIGTFLDSINNNCSECHKTCEQCQNETENGCLSCANGKKLYQSGYGASCLSACPSGLYVGDNNICQSCYFSCQTCQGPESKDCVLCQDKLFKSEEGQCYYKCPQFFFGDVADYKCQPCHSTCQSCNGLTSNNCITCQDTLWLLNLNTCVQKCPNPDLAETFSRQCLSYLLRNEIILFFILLIIDLYFE